jgi:hypothetical protein
MGILAILQPPALSALVKGNDGEFRAAEDDSSMLD